MAWYCWTLIVLFLALTVAGWVLGEAPDYDDDRDSR